MELKQKRIPVEMTIICPYIVNTGMFAGLKTTVSWLLPILDQCQVADDIRKAIIDRKESVFLPWLYEYLLVVYRLLPPKI